LISRLLRHAAVVLCFVAFFFIFPGSSAAQTAPRLQISGNYSYLRFGSKQLGFTDDSGLKGGNAGFTFNIKPYFGVVGEIGGEWGAPFKFYDALAGPRIQWPHNKLTLYGQGLFGKVKARIALPNEPNNGHSEAAIGYSFGGGVEYALTPHFSIRAIHADYMIAHVFSTDQRNIRVSVGITYNLGRIGRKRHRLP
jgi:outer membrane protein with beta-barrel domain